MTHSPTPTELLALKVANAALLESRDAFCDMVATVVFALGSAQILQSPETAAKAARHREELRVRRNEDMALRDELIHARRPVPFELGDSLVPAVRWLIARVAELEAAQPVVLPDAECLVCGEDLDDENITDFCSDRCVPNTPPLGEDTYVSPLRHDYRVGHDLPEVPHA